MNTDDPEFDMDGSVLHKSGRTGRERADRRAEESRDMRFGKMRFGRVAALSCFAPLPVWCVQG